MSNNPLERSAREAKWRASQLGSDPFAPAVSRPSRCPGCGGYGGGHFVNCAIMREQETERMVKRNGICSSCNLVKPCDCPSEVAATS